jgi:hypothetical protein
LRRQVPGRSKPFNELFKQYRDDKSAPPTATPSSSSSTTIEITEDNNYNNNNNLQNFTNEVFIPTETSNFVSVDNNNDLSPSLSSMLHPGQQKQPLLPSGPQPLLPLPLPSQSFVDAFNENIKRANAGVGGGGDIGGKNVNTTKKIPLVRSTNTTPNKKETENINSESFYQHNNDTPSVLSNFTDINFKTTHPITNLSAASSTSSHNFNNIKKFDNDHFLDDQFTTTTSNNNNNENFKFNNTATSNDFINTKYETNNSNSLNNNSSNNYNINSHQTEAIGEIIMPNGDIDYRHINHHLPQSNGFNIIPEINSQFEYQQPQQQINNTFLQNSHHLKTHHYTNNNNLCETSNDIVYLSSSPPSSLSRSSFQQNQNLLTSPSSPPPQSSSSSSSSTTLSSDTYYFDSILSKINQTNNIVKHHPRPSAVTSFNARLTNNGGGYTLWNRRQDNLRNLLCNAFETATSQYSSSSSSKSNNGFSFNQPPLINNNSVNKPSNTTTSTAAAVTASWVSPPTSSLNSNRANTSVQNEYVSNSSHNNKSINFNGNKSFDNDFRSKNVNLDGEKNHYSLSALINKKNSFNIGNNNNNNNPTLLPNNNLTPLKNRETHQPLLSSSSSMPNFSNQHHFQHQHHHHQYVNNNINSNSNIKSDFLTSAIKKAAASNTPTPNNAVTGSMSHLQSVSSSSFSNSSHSWVI